MLALTVYVAMKICVFCLYVYSNIIFVISLVISRNRCAATRRMIRIAQERYQKYFCMRLLQNKTIPCHLSVTMSEGCNAED